MFQKISMIFLAVSMLGLPCAASGEVEVAPRISDREIASGIHNQPYGCHVRQCHGVDHCPCGIHDLGPPDSPETVEGKNGKSGRSLPTGEQAP